MNTMLGAVQRRNIKAILDDELYVTTDMAEIEDWLSCGDTDMTTFYMPDRRSITGEPPLYQIDTIGYGAFVKLIIYRVVSTCYVKLSEWPVPKECEFFADGKVINMKTTGDTRLPPWEALTTYTDATFKLRQVSLNGCAPMTEIRYAKGRFSKTLPLMSLIVRRDAPEISREY